MRRYLQILGLVGLALAASGWGAVAAAVLCPHANSAASMRGEANSAAEEPACHQVKPEPVAKPHCHDSGAEQEAGGAAVEAEARRALTVASGDATALAVPQNLPCTHCLSRPEVPASTVIARQQSEQKRSFETPALQAITLVLPTHSFTKPLMYRQGAPPGPPTPRHLLTGILLI